MHRGGMGDLGDGRFSGDAEALGKTLAVYALAGGKNIRAVPETLQKSLFKMPELVYNNKNQKDKRPRNAEGRSFR